MKGYSINIEDKTKENNYFREVLHTTQDLQLVVMSIAPKEDIGEEIHEINDQFIRIEAGEGEAILNGKSVPLSDGVVVIIPAGTKHNIINKSSNKQLKLYSLYSPPHHKDKTIHKTKEDALEDEDDHYT